MNASVSSVRKINKGTATVFKATFGNVSTQEPVSRAGRPKKRPHSKREACSTAADVNVQGDAKMSSSGSETESMSSSDTEDEAKEPQIRPRLSLLPHETDTKRAKTSMSGSETESMPSSDTENEAKKPQKRPRLSLLPHETDTKRAKTSMSGSEAESMPSSDIENEAIEAHKGPHTLSQLYGNTLDAEAKEAMPNSETSAYATSAAAAAAVSSTEIHAVVPDKAIHVYFKYFQAPKVRKTVVYIFVLKYCEPHLQVHEGFSSVIHQPFVFLPRASPQLSRMCVSFL
jgi:hypothetical protein